MISNKKNNPLIKAIVIIIIALVTCTVTVAQNEIPDHIKDYIINGVSALESAKSPQDIENAYNFFSKAAELAPDYPDVHYFLGRTLALIQGNIKRAVKELKLYLEMYPGAPDKEDVYAEITSLEKSLGSKKSEYLLGISLVELIDGIYVYRVSPNYPPFGRRGVPIKSGDKLIGINNIDIAGYSLQEVLQIFEADSLDIEKPRKITVVRGGTEYKLDMYKRKKDLDFRIKDLGEDDLKELIQNSIKPMAVFFVSDWCPDCQKYFDDRTVQNPTYEYRNDMSFIYANIDERSSLKDDFAIKGTPEIHLYKNGKLFDVVNGYDRDLFIEKVKELMQ